MTIVRDTIYREIREVAAEVDRPLAALHDDLELLNSGLDSLSMAVLFARLEDIFGLDPFDGGAFTVVTVGDIVSAYSQT